MEVAKVTVCQCRSALSNYLFLNHVTSPLSTTQEMVTPAYLYHSLAE